ncbi:MAG: MFS transporter [Proteobacteria bacterium]|nr:MFS transporter [Pseudomonadota bacterium]
MVENKIFYGWVLVPIFGLIYLINVGFPIVGASVTNTYMIQDLNLGRGILGLGFTVSGLFGGLSSPIIAFYIKTRGVRFTLFIGSLFLILGALLMGTVVTKGWQYVAVFGVLLGIGSGFGSMIPVQAGITLWFRKKKALAMSLAITIGSLGGFLAPPLLNKIIFVADGNWRIAWFFIIGLLILSAILILSLVKNKPSDMGLIQDGANNYAETSLSVDAKSTAPMEVYRSTVEWKVSDAIKTHTFWLLFVSSLAFVGPMMFFMAHAVIYLQDMGHPAGISAMAVSYYMLFSLFGRLLGGSFADRFEPRYIWAAGLLLEAVGILFFLDAKSVASIYLFAIPVGVGVGAASICWPTLIGNYFGTNSFASIMGTLFPVVQLFGASAPFFAGLVYDTQGSYRMAFIASAALAFIGSIVIFFTKPPKTIAAKSHPVAAS